MNKLLIALSIASAILLAGGVYHMSQSNSNAHIPSEIENMFESWKSTHSKTYGSDEEEILRKTVFHQNVQKINAHNASGKSWKMAINHFADLTSEEFKQSLGGNQNPRFLSSFAKRTTYLVQDETESVDWRKKGAVTEVKNQEQCGSCWAFSTTGALEGGWFLKSGNLISMSEQQLVNCSTQNNGCGGGAAQYAMDYVEQNGIETEADYPYAYQTQKTCVYDRSKVIEGFNLPSYTNVPRNDNDQLKAAVTKMPVSIAMNGSPFQHYSSGVFDDVNCDTQINHAVLAVGYDVTDSLSGEKYYIVKNSWGASWGENGYFRILRQEGSGPGVCGMTQQACYPEF